MPSAANPAEAMASYEEARQAGLIGDYGSGLSSDAGFHDGVREAEERRRNPGAHGAGLNPLGFIGLFALTCGALALLYGLIASVVAAFVIAAATRISVGSTAFRPLLKGAYAASVLPQAAWVVLTFVIVWAGSVLKIESHANLAKALASLGHRPLPYGFSWYSAQTLTAILTIVGPGVLAHAALLSRQLGAPYAGVAGALRAVIVSAVAIPVGFAFFAALVVVFVGSKGLKTQSVEYPPALLTRGGLYLLIDVVAASGLGAIVFRVATRRTPWVTWWSSYKTAFLCLAAHVVLTTTVICIKVHLVTDDPLIWISQAFLVWPDPLRRLLVSSYRFGSAVPTLLFAQVPGLLAGWYLVSREVATGRKPVARNWRALFIALAFIVVADVSILLIVALVPATKLFALVR